MRPMKTELMALAILVVTILSFTPERLFADYTHSIDALSMQEALLDIGRLNKINADVEFKIELPDYPRIRPVVFNKSASIPYMTGENAIRINGCGIPNLISELKEVPEEFKPITLAISGVSGNITSITWNTYDDKTDIQVKHLDLTVRFYAKHHYETNDSIRPDLEFVLSDIDVSHVEYNKENSVVMLDFDTILPKIGNEIFDEYIAGKKVSGLITITLE